jgi:uncharacterized membrane protein
MHEVNIYDIIIGLIATFEMFIAMIALYISIDAIGNKDIGTFRQFIQTFNVIVFVMVVVFYTFNLMLI